MLLLKQKQVQLLLQGQIAVEVRTIENLFNFFEGKAQFFKQQDMLQAFQRSFIIQAVSGFSDPGRF